MSLPLIPLLKNPFPSGRFAKSLPSSLGTKGGVFPPSAFRLKPFPCRLTFPFLWHNLVSKATTSAPGFKIFGGDPSPFFVPLTMRGYHLPFWAAREPRP